MGRTDGRILRRFGNTRTCVPRTILSVSRARRDRVETYFGTEPPSYERVIYTDNLYRRADGLDVTVSKTLRARGKHVRRCYFSTDETIRKMRRATDRSGPSVRVRRHVPEWTK